MTHGENDFLQLASEAGLLGISVLGFLVLYLFLKAYRGIHVLSSRKTQRYIVMGGLVGILALMFHSSMERNIQVSANAFLFTYLWAFILKLPGLETYQRNTYVA